MGPPDNDDKKWNSSKRLSGVFEAVELMERDYR